MEERWRKVGKAGTEERWSGGRRKYGEETEDGKSVERSEVLAERAGLSGVLLPLVLYFR